MRLERRAGEWGLDGHDRRRLRDALRRTTDLRHHRRLQAVLAVAQGRGCRDAAASTGLGRWAVYKWVRSYLRGRRPEDLMDRPRSGRPRAARRITDARIVREYERDPLGLGLMATEWTTALLARRLSEKYGCPITTRTLRRRLKAIGLVWKRPRHVFHEKDPRGGVKKGRSNAA
jgi:transposase